MENLWAYLISGILKELFALTSFTNFTFEKILLRQITPKLKFLKLCGYSYIWSKWNDMYIQQPDWYSGTVANNYPYLKTAKQMKHCIYIIMKMSV